MKLLSCHEKKFLLAFVFVTIFSYGFLVPFTGFYWDDWPFAWIANFLGPSEFLPAFIGIRPFLIPIFVATTSLIPPVPIYWQIFALLIRFLAGLSTWFVLKNVWPRFKLQMLVASLLVIVFSAYSQHWVAYTHINQEWIAFILYLLSMGFTASSLRNPQKIKAYSTYAILLLFEGLFATEYFFGMEPLRFLFIWVIVSTSTMEMKAGFFRAFKIWLPYLGLWLLNGFWLSWFYSQGYNSYELGLFNSPKPVIRVLYELGKTIWKAGFYAWIQVLVLTLKNITAPSSILTFMLIGLSFIILLPILKKASDSPLILKTTSNHFIMIGLIGIVLGRAPSLAAGLPFRLQSSYDRFAISMMLGGSLFTMGLVDWLVNNPRIKVYIFAALIALGMGQQFFNGNIFRRDWERQQEIFWQMKWRMPSLEPNTLIITDEIAVDYESDTSLTGPINWIFAPDYDGGKLPYLLLFMSSRLGSSLPSLEPDTDFQFSIRTVTFQGNTSNAVVIHMPESGCLRVFNPKLGDRETYNRKKWPVLDAIHLSNTTLIHQEEIKAPSFLSEPDKTWCYYYTKAELARQYKDWAKIVNLQEEANAYGYRPVDSFEWLPFIEANAMTMNLDTAKQLSMDAMKNDDGIRVGLCMVWRRVLARDPGGGDTEAFVLDLLSGFQCG